MHTTIITHPNIALIKYWGKRDDQLFLPTKSSLSIGIEALTTTTTIQHASEQHDIIMFEKQPATEKQQLPILEFLHFFRKTFPATQEPLLIETSNSFPTAAGLASSASGFAALALGLNNYFHLGLSKQQLSILARQGSGSACRSIFDGFVLWSRGKEKDGSDSYATQLHPAEHWPSLRVIIAVVATEEKRISSRLAMKNSIATSPLYQDWIKKSEKNLELMQHAITDKNFDLVGQLAEEDCLDMHATMHTSTPPVNFWTSATYSVMQLVKQLRTEQAISCYFTIDAGANVKILCQEADVPKITTHLNATPCVINHIVSKIA